MKKTFAIILSLMLILATLVGCAGTPAAEPATEATEATAAEAATEAPAAEPAASGDKVINIYSFTDEVPKMLDKYVASHPDFGYTINATIIATTDGLYQPALDQALAAGGADAPDMYCCEAAFVLKYTQGDMSSYAAAYKDLGIDVDNEIKAADIAQYTIDIGTRPSDSALVGLGYQATGGAFIYRRSLAIDTWGTDDPAVIKTKIGPGWDQFFTAAAELKDKGYGIVSGDGDIWHAVENSSPAGWIVDGKLNIDPAREAFLDLSKQLKDNGYHNDTKDWTDAWYADMKGVGAQPIFGFFGPAWLINYVMAGNSGGTKAGEGTYGDWAVCEPPVGFFWGGTWVLANKDSSKLEAVGKLIDWITLQTGEDGLQYMWANGTLNGEGGTKDTVASGTVMAKSNGELEFLGGQNMFDVFVPANQFANGKNLTQYDETINNLWRDQVRQYTAGNCTRDEALAAFKQAVTDTLGIEAN
ncbi:MAG: carbohydrate ABC transporter substrate-binding protein [Eubacteriales bacterium]|nr:carbohydrate ABC transporter substrate-binding protein [Eubacteriales bacterium]